jgi:hypothetical protein
MQLTKGCLLVTLSLLSSYYRQADSRLLHIQIIDLAITVHLLSLLAVTGAGYSSGTWIHPRDYTGGLKPHE